MNVEPSHPLSAGVHGLTGKTQNPPGSLRPVVVGTDQGLLFQTPIPELSKVLQKCQPALVLPSSEHPCTSHFIPTGPAQFREGCSDGGGLQRPPPRGSG